MVALPPRRILVVEDEPPIRNINTKMLINAGYHVDSAEDGVAAWTALQARPYDLLITDNNMPRMSGVELLQKIHANGVRLPVIMATGTAPAQRLCDPWSQPVPVLLKPYTAVELLETVKEVLRKANPVDGGPALDASSLTKVS